MWVFCAFVWIFWWRLWFWLRAIGGFGFLIHSEFLVEVVVVGFWVFAVGGGGAGFGSIGYSAVYGFFDGRI